VPQAFDVNDALHMDFIISTANLWAALYGVKESHLDANYFRQALAHVTVPEFVPKSGVKIKEKDDDQVQEGAVDDSVAVQQLLKSLPDAAQFRDRKLNAQEFEKDVDANHHIDYIAAASNLRARNYEITNVTRHQVKGIAGKIIPAVATTTCMITGLVCLELYKVVQKRPLDHFKNAFVNLAIPIAAFSEPLPPAKHTSQPPSKSKRCQISCLVPVLTCPTHSWSSCAMCS
jgi:ubiquitin-activating enzyme E1